MNVNPFVPWCNLNLLVRDEPYFTEFYKPHVTMWEVGFCWDLCSSYEMHLEMYFVKKV